MKKYFVFSDVHGHCGALTRALRDAGFEEANPEHIIISCGDMFDRGNGSVEILKWLEVFPPERKILIKGNHEVLLRKCIDRKMVMSHDVSNGTVGTLLSFAEMTHPDGFTSIDEVYESADRYAPWRRYEDSLVNYYETEHYVFVHSWVAPGDWRNATDDAWYKAMWDNPFSKAIGGKNNTGKTIVFGHWACRQYRNNDDDSTVILPNCIGLDTCTVVSKKVNVLVIEEEDI